ncbi:glycoside hydrolase family 88 protein [Cohnella rhizosphaerae]|uniref:Glycoside hydrolase family 88 protein n=1 Tax=Cohnella rhizosphaerae TaxID=1457232 RepID=A0A9X4QTJ9_9BACL|nr:glycoside hydrolase family 88 protein [Cohnella rhizosphaerae]MDG0809547.1 glycoside hydrolase family 88 protein [Cohnella rhizosphaerae]
MMNLPLLYWASREIEDPRYRLIAEIHADTVLREFVQADGSVHHIVSFDPETGERRGALAGQGYAADSAWSRGAAWALYGFALSYTYTGKDKYLAAAQKAARFFLDHLPADLVPYWDFRLPADAEEMPKDSSAAAIAASGLMELAFSLQGGEGGRGKRTSRRPKACFVRCMKTMARGMRTKKGCCSMRPAITLRRSAWTRRLSMEITILPKRCLS